MKLRQLNKCILFKFIWCYLKIFPLMLFNSFQIILIFIKMESFACYKWYCIVGKSISQLKSHFRQFHNMSLNNRLDRSEEFIYAQGTCTKRYYQYRSLARHLLKHIQDSSHNLKNAPLCNVATQQQPSISTILENVSDQENVVI